MSGEQRAAAPVGPWCPLPRDRGHFAPGHAQGCWDGALHWHSKCHRATKRSLAPFVIPHGGKKECFRVFNDPKQSGIWCFISEGVLQEPFSPAQRGAQHHSALGQAEPTLTEVTATPEPAKGFLESSQAGIDQTHLDSIHHLTKEQAGRLQW